MDSILKSFSLEGKKAIVTGGAKGLCLTMAKALHEAGAEIVLVDIMELVKDTAAQMNESGAPVHYVIGDLGNEYLIKKIFAQALEKLGGRVDILLNGASIQYRSKAEEFPADKWNAILNINLSAVFFLSQEAGRQMLKQKYGKIINIASMTSFVASVMIPAYSASKGGVAQLTKALSNEWASQGINVNAIAPGYMKTELTKNIKEVNPKQYEELTNRIPAGRWGDPEDLAGIAVFLASDASRYISGAVIPVDGGFLGK